MNHSDSFRYAFKRLARPGIKGRGRISFKRALHRTVTITRRIQVPAQPVGAMLSAAARCSPGVSNAKACDWGKNGRLGMKKKVKVTRAQHKALQLLSRKDINTIRRHPGIVGSAKDLLRACRKVVKRVEAIPEHASRRKRATAYKRILHICRKAIDNASR